MLQNSIKGKRFTQLKLCDWILHQRWGIITVNTTRRFKTQQICLSALIDTDDHCLREACLAACVLFFCRNKPKRDKEVENCPSCVAISTVKI